MNKILFVINSLAAGGAEKLVVDMSNYLAEKNYQVSLFTFVNENDVFDAILSPQVHFQTSRSKNFYSLKNFIELFKLIGKSDIVHVHLFPSFYLVGIISVLFPNKKFIYTEHSTHNKRRKTYLRWIERLIYSRYKIITCISVGVKSSLSSWIGSNSKIVLVENFVDLVKIENSLPADLVSVGLQVNDVNLVMVGSFRGHEKDQMSVIKAMTFLPSNYKLFLIGDGILKNGHVNYARELSLTSRVSFLGIQNNVSSIIKLCDYGVLSSTWEGFGLVALEYMACGIPAIGSNVEGLNEVITNSLCLFKVGDSRKIADIILFLENDPVTKKMVLEHQKTSLNKYNIHTAMSRFIELYKS